MSREDFKRRKVLKFTTIVYMAIVHIILLALIYSSITYRGVVNQSQAAAIGYGIALKKCITDKENNCITLRLKSVEFQRPGFQDDSCAEWELVYTTNDKGAWTMVWLDAKGKQMPHDTLPTGNGTC